MCNDKQPHKIQSPCLNKGKCGTTSGQKPHSHRRMVLSFPSVPCTQLNLYLEGPEVHLLGCALDRLTGEPACVNVCKHCFCTMLHSFAGYGPISTHIKVKPKHRNRSGVMNIIYCFNKNTINLKNKQTNKKSCDFDCLPPVASSPCSNSIREAKPSPPSPLRAHHGTDIPSSCFSDRGDGGMQAVWDEKEGLTQHIKGNVSFIDHRKTALAG